MRRPYLLAAVFHPLRRFLAARLGENKRLIFRLPLEIADFAVQFLTVGRRS
jgi:hypothetical protein